MVSAGGRARRSCRSSNKSNKKSELCRMRFRTSSDFMCRRMEYSGECQGRKILAHCREVRFERAVLIKNHDSLYCLCPVFGFGRFGFRQGAIFGERHCLGFGGGICGPELSEQFVRLSRAFGCRPGKQFRLFCIGRRRCRFFGVTVHRAGVEQQPVGVDARESSENFLKQVESRFVASGQNMGESRRVHSEHVGKLA